MRQFAVCWKLGGMDRVEDQWCTPYRDVHTQHTGGEQALCRVSLLTLTARASVNKLNAPHFALGCVGPPTTTKTATTATTTTTISHVLPHFPSWLFVFPAWLDWHPRSSDRSRAISCHGQTVASSCPSSPSQRQEIAPCVRVHGTWTELTAMEGKIKKMLDDGAWAAGQSGGSVVTL